MQGKVKQQPEGDDGAGHIRHQPARVAHHLQNAALVVAIEARLVIRLAPVPQRVVHVDQHFTPFTGVGPIQQYAAGKILRDFCTGIFVVIEFLQVKAERFVMALRSQGDFVGAAAVIESLDASEKGRNQECSDGFLFIGQFHNGGRRKGGIEERIMAVTTEQHVAGAFRPDNDLQSWP